jgi:hypothetical protein
LAEQMRDDGYPVSSAKASLLVKILRAEAPGGSAVTAAA